MARASRPAASAYSFSYATRPSGSAPARPAPARPALARPAPARSALARSALRASGSSQIASTISAANPALRKHTSRHMLHAVPASGTRCDAPSAGEAADPAPGSDITTLSAATRTAKTFPSVPAPRGPTAPPHSARTPPGNAQTPPGNAPPPPGNAPTPPGNAPTPRGNAPTGWITCEFAALCDSDVRIRRSKSHDASKSHVKSDIPRDLGRGSATAGARAALAGACAALGGACATWAGPRPRPG